MKQWIKSAVIIVCILLVSACSRQESAINNSKMTQSENDANTNTSDANGTNEASSNDSVETDGDTTTSDQTTLDSSQLTTIETEKAPHSSLNYNCDIEADKENYDINNVDIVVGDDYFSTQINDWYENFDEYEGKLIEIEGYYISDYLPYLFVGRYGPTCPYCQGGYVCFEFYTKEDLTDLVSGQDWIKVKGILRKDEDEYGEFNYIETLSVEKMDQTGVDTVSN